MHHAKNQHVLVFDAVENDLAAFGQAAISGSELVIARTSDIRKAERKETVCDPVNQAISNVDVAAFLGAISR